MNRNLAILVFVVLFSLSPFFVNLVYAPPIPPTPQPIPIDGGLGFLLAAGVAYAARRLYKKKDREI